MKTTYLMETSTTWV